MSKFHKNPGPFLKHTFIPDKRIERAALGLLEETRLMPSSPAKVQIDKVCDRKWGFPEDYRDLGDEYMGRATFTVNGLASIEVNARLEEDRSRPGVCRLRSTVAHEIGHGVLHESLFVEKLRFERDQMSLFADVERPPAPAAQIMTRGNVTGVAQPFDWWELQANRFMAEILMPKPLFLQVIGHRMDPDRVASWRFGAVEPVMIQQDVAEAFHVSYQMAEIAVSRHRQQMLKGIERAPALC
jgi:Zn-dependent peptidase ImmA (M78 family)